MLHVLATDGPICCALWLADWLLREDGMRIVNQQQQQSACLCPYNRSSQPARQLMEAILISIMKAGWAGWQGRNVTGSASLWAFLPRTTCCTIKTLSVQIFVGCISRTSSSIDLQTQIFPRALLLVVSNYFCMFCGCSSRTSAWCTRRHR